MVSAKVIKEHLVDTNAYIPLLLELTDQIVKAHHVSGYAWGDLYMEDEDGVRYTEKGQDIFNRELDKVASILHNYGIIETIELQKSTA